MGAAQSKKKRKEKKRRKRFHPGSPNYYMPRSASVDYIRNHSLALTSCPHCQGGNTVGGSSAVWGLLHKPYPCSCRDRHRVRDDDGLDETDGYQSCPSYSTSYCFLSSTSHVGVMSSHGGLEMERSTMSLNRNLKVINTRIVQSKSSEFSELLDILKRYEDRKRELSLILSPHPPRETIESNRKDPVQALGSVSDGHSEPRESSASVKVSTNSCAKKPITILEDEESRLARWQRQKQMAQQLRTLRKHIQLQEASQQKLPIPFLSESFGEKSGTQDQPSASASESTPKRAFGNTPRVNRSKFAKMSNYRYLDNHPVLSKLQNEQNNRLESMERRMKEIRISAMQEAERRKFAEIFPAKRDNTLTEKMMQEAKETLEKIKEEKKRRKEEVRTNEAPGSQSDSATNDSGVASVDDSGEVIPVHIETDIANRHIERISVEEQQTVSKTELTEAKPNNQTKKADWLNNAWPNINLDQPLTWLVLPFLLFPLILRMLLCLIFNTGNAAGHAADSRSTSHRETKPKR